MLSNQHKQRVKSKVEQRFEEMRRSRQENFLQHVRPEILERAEADEPVTADEIAAGRMNSYERKLLHDRLDNHALTTVTRAYLTQTSWGNLPVRKWETPDSYDDAIQRQFLPMLLDRFEEMTNELEELKEENALLRMAPKPAPGDGGKPGL